LSGGDRIVLLDDQWALVQSGAQALSTYLALASSMGSDLNERAWNQITGALGTIEYDERGNPGHDAFTVYARKIIRPVADRLGWDSKPEETPGIQKLRRRVLRDLGEWGDTEVIAEARKRFETFFKDRKAIGPDDQEMILAIVARNADEAAFKQLHEIAKSAHDETEMRRYYTSLMRVRDPKLAEQAVPIALSDEIPAQADHQRLGLVGTLAEWHPLLAWKAFTENSDVLMKPHSTFAPQMLARYVPWGYWNAVPLDQIEAWVKAHVPAEMAPDIARGKDEAQFHVALKKALVPATDSYVQVSSDKSKPAALE
jgi:aminopeptidase N